MNFQIKKVALRIGIFCLILGGLATFTRFDICLTKSLDGVNYVLTLKRSFPFQPPIAHGDIVSIQGHTPHYVGKHIFAKRVLGLPGDRILRKKDSLRVSSKTLPLLSQTKEGQLLTPLSLNVVPQGYVFVVGDHPRSFDSRYEEFGLVPMEKIYGKAVLKW
ncbi:MAG: signal peptidase I [Alphaproteobacteria bacterium]|nr:signal peptidase I [Alphaproteobacteria bacterium]MBP9776765.1 signal peptidase I [Alphaproteobacteria bacterium]